MRPRRAVLSALIAAATALAAAPAPAQPPSAYQRPGVNELVSRALHGGVPDDSSFFAGVSDDGRRVLFSSRATDIVAEPVRGQGDIYVRDVDGSIRLVSAAVGGGGGNGMSFQPSISGDGSHVVFLSYASDLVEPAGDKQLNAAQVYVHDLEQGATQRITSAVGGGPSTGGALGPKLSRDGALVAFFSHGGDLVPGDTNGVADVFVHDRGSGQTRRVSLTPTGEQLDRSSTAPAFSGDGRSLAFTTSATNMLPYPGQLPGGVPGVVPITHVYTVDLETGGIERASVSTHGTPGDRNSFSPRITLSDDGRFVAFQSEATNLVPHDANGASNPLNGQDVFVRDRLAQTTERVSLAPDGAEMTGKSLSPSISGDGRFVAFESLKPGADPSSFIAPYDTYLHDRLTADTELLSATADGEPGGDSSRNAVLTPDATRVVMQTDATDLVGLPAGDSTVIVMRERGRPTGTFAASARAGGDGHQVVGGLVGFEGLVLSAAKAPPGAAEVPLREAVVAYRPERGDLLVRWRPDRLPSVGVPSVTFSTATAGPAFRLRFVLAGTTYEVRAGSLAGVAAGPVGDAGPAVAALYRCDLVCELVAPLRGGYGTAGHEVRTAVPLALLDAGPGDRLATLRAAVGPGDTVSGPLAPAAELALTDVEIPGTGVTLAVAPAGSAPAEVAFTSPAAVERGRFSASLHVPAGLQVWARACSGPRCSVAPLWSDQG